MQTLQVWLLPYYHVTFIVAENQHRVHQTMYDKLDWRLLHNSKHLPAHANADTALLT